MTEGRWKDDGKLTERPSIPKISQNVCTASVRTILRTPVQTSWTSSQTSVQTSSRKTARMSSRTPVRTPSRTSSWTSSRTSVRTSVRIASSPNVTCVDGSACVCQICHANPMNYNHHVLTKTILILAGVSAMVLRPRCRRGFAKSICENLCASMSDNRAAARGKQHIARQRAFAASLSQRL